MDDELCQAIDEVGMTLEQLLEMFERMKRIRADGGYGVVSVVLKRGQVYQVEHTVHGKPAVFKNGSLDCN